MSLAHHLVPVLSVLTIALAAPPGPCGRCQPLAERPAKLSGPTMSDGWWSRRPISRDTIFRQRTEPVLQKSDRGGSNRR